MTKHNSEHRMSRLGKLNPPLRRVMSGVVVFLGVLSGSVGAQEVRYSWLDLSFTGQTVDRQGTQVPIVGQTVDIDAQDGEGVRFRGSFGTWKNLYLFGDYSSTDIDISGVVTNSQGMFPAEDEFDLTTIRAGVGVKFSVGFSTDLYAELSYDSIDFDFGSFAGENFDADNKDVGAALGVRYMLSDNIQLSAYGRFSNHADFDPNTLEFEKGEYFGVGFGWQIVRGLSLVADYESGELEAWSVGFRLDMSEN